MSIDTPRSDQDEAVEVWKMLDAVCAGKGVEHYLRKLVCAGKGDQLRDDDRRQKEYAEAAVFYRITGHTLEGLLGTMFRRDPTFEPPPRLRYLLKNADGKGNGLVQQSKGVGKAVLSKGRSALWVNYPKTQGETSVADQGRYFATVHRLRAEQVINWQTMADGANVKLSLVVFRYQDEQLVDYEIKCTDKIKELALDEFGFYFVREWEKMKTAEDGEKWIEGEPVYPEDASGNRFREIPFTFVGATNNDAEIDEQPMYGLAKLNIAHYRNSADFEDSVFWSGQSQPYVRGADEAWFDLVEQHDIRIGSRQVMPVPENGDFGFATPAPNPLVRQAMIDKVELMIGIGARFISPGGSAKTAYEAGADRESQHSILSMVANNVSDAYTRALAWVAAFMGTDAPEYVIDSDYSDVGSTPQLLAVWVKGYLDGAVPEEQYIGWMQRQGYFDAQAEQDEIAEQLSAASIGAGGPNSNLGEVENEDGQDEA